MGHRSDSEGIHSTQEKVYAIRKAITPQIVLELCSFLAFVNYYYHYLNNISTIQAPLYKLLQNGISWKWGPGEVFAIEQSKSLLISTNVFFQYNDELKLIMTVDASPIGWLVGWVLWHINLLWFISSQILFMYIFQLYMNYKGIFRSLTFLNKPELTCLHTAKIIPSITV